MHPDDHEILQFRLRAAAVLITALLLAIANYPAWADDHAYYFTGLERFPAWNRPSADQARRISDSSTLVRALRTNGHNFERLRLFLPARFRVAQGEDFQSTIDDTVLTISRSEAGRKMICPFAAEKEQDLVMYFGVSKGAARALRSTCRGIPVPPALVYQLKNMRDVRPPFVPEPRVPAKKFVLIFSEAERPEIEGYTAKSNVTYLVLSRETMNRDTVRRMIAHELAISYDQLERFGYIIDPVTLENGGTGLAFGLSIMEQVFEPMSIAEVKRLQCAFRDPALRFGNAAHRAFVFEDQVFADQAPVAAQGTCRQILAKNSVLLQVMARTVAWDNGDYTARCGNMASEAGARVRQVLDRISIVESKRLRCANRAACGGQAEMSLCDLLLHPRTGPNERDLESAGPRPRMGGWGGNQMKDSSTMERAANGEALTPEELSRLGERLKMPNNTSDLDSPDYRRRAQEPSP